MAMDHDLATKDPNHNPTDPESVAVINDWHLAHNNHGERELALAIAERNRQHRRNTIDTRRAAPDEHQPGGGTPRGMWSS